MFISGNGTVRKHNYILGWCTSRRKACWCLYDQDRKMVFESVVVDVLNRFLGDYVVNLDCSQLSLGIWGGKCGRCQNQVFTLLKQTAGAKPVFRWTSGVVKWSWNARLLTKIATLRCHVRVVAWHWVSSGLSMRLASSCYVQPLLNHY